MNIRRIVAALALLLVTTPALAQVTNPWPRFIPVRPDGSVIDPGSVGGGGGGGIVTQGSAATDTAANRWPVLAYQGGTWNFGLSGPIPTGSNVIGAVTQSGTWNVAASQSGTWSFGLTGPIPTGSNVIGAVTQSGGPWTVSGTINAIQSGTWNVGLASGASVLADLRVAGAAVTSGNPVPVSVGNFPSSQAVTNAGTFAVQNTAALPAGTNTIGSINNIGGTISLPTGAATANNQSLEITQLTAANQRSAYYVDYGPGTLAANATANNNAFDAGPQPTQYTKFNASFSSTQTITAVIQGSYDGATFFEVYFGTVPAPTANATYGALVVSVPVTFRYYRTKIIGNASNSATVLVNHSFSTN